MDSADDVDGLSDSLPARDVYRGIAVRQASVSPMREAATYAPYSSPMSGSPPPSFSASFGTILQCDGGDDDDLIDFTDKVNAAAGPSQPGGSSHPGGSQPTRPRGGYVPSLGSVFTMLQPVRASNVAGMLSACLSLIRIGLSLISFLPHFLGF